MRRHLLIATTAACLLVPGLAFGGGPVTPIKVGDDFFKPRKPATLPFGGGFSWQRKAGATGEHNVRQDAKLFRSGNASETSFTTLYYVYPSAGSYHYYCEIHGFRNGGMDGVIKVRPVVENGTLTSHEFRVQWAYEFEHTTGSRFDVRYRVDSRRWKLWKNDTKAFDGDFGLKDRPVHVSPTHTYRIDVRSEGQNVTRRSDWSPALTVHPPPSG